jgi:hypothetical protein
MRFLPLINTRSRQPSFVEADSSVSYYHATDENISIERSIFEIIPGHELCIYKCTLANMRETAISFSTCLATDMPSMYQHSFWQTSNQCFLYLKDVCFFAKKYTFYSSALAHQFPSRCKYIHKNVNKKIKVAVSY